MSICDHARVLRRGVALTLIMSGAVVVAVSSSGCVYRMAVQQGNFLDPVQVQQLQTGMTRAQVRFLLGTPMLPDAFKRDRWDYIYYLKTGRIKKPVERRLTVWFDGEKVARFENVGIALPEAGAMPASTAGSSGSATSPPAAPAVAPVATSAPPSG